MEPIQKGKQTNKTSNTCASDKGKQTNKQAEAACAEAQMQGVVQSCITCGAWYTMCQSMRKSFRDASEKCRVQYAGSYSDSGAELRNMQSPICNASEYAEELQRCVGKVQSLICRVIL